jgi:mannose/fructose/N-acetylgalactosamine-specific phosphotransferase system component IID
MYRLLIIAFVALLAGQQAVHAQTAVQPGLAPTTTENGALPYVVALGAIAGIVVFNVAALGIEALPGGMAYASGATVPAEMSVAMSRVYAGASAVIGGLIADYIYTSR